jgi:hypothetical protein
LQKSTLMAPTSLQMQTNTLHTTKGWRRYDSSYNKKPTSSQRQTRA